MGVALLTITPNDLLAKFLLLVPMTMLFWLRGLRPKGKMLPSEDIIMIPLNWELKLLPGCFGPFMPLTQQAK